MGVIEQMLARYPDREGQRDLALRGVMPEIALAKVREDAPFDKICYIGCGVTTGIGAVINTAGVEIGSSAAVFGLGGALSRAQIHPDNVWSLRGLNDCLVARGASESVEGRMIAQRLALAEGRADGKVGASCYCAQAAQ